MLPRLLLLTASLVGLAAACSHPSSAAPVEGNYGGVRQRVEAERRRLARAFAAARTPEARRETLTEAQGAMVRVLADEIMPAWLGTPWAFNGTSAEPQVGSIACGHFVATVLQDAGLGVDRLRLGRQASENIIKTLTGEANIRRFSDAPLTEFVEGVLAMGDGVFVVGLDTHAGMMVVRAGQARLVHSVNLGCWCVMDEDARVSSVLERSRYRVVGKISDDLGLVERWLRGAAIPTVGPH